MVQLRQKGKKLKFLVEGLTYQEICDITGESLSNVKVRIHRAKAKIRDLLAPHIKEFAEHKITL